MEQNTSAIPDLLIDSFSGALEVFVDATVELQRLHEAQLDMERKNMNRCGVVGNFCGALEVHVCP